MGIYSADNKLIRWQGRTMIDTDRDDHAVLDFRKWYRRRYEWQRGIVARHALDKCEDAFLQREWNGFAYWYAIYRRERSKLMRSG
jgi:hypothetical protein